MKKGNAAELAVAVYDILNRYSDDIHLVSMPNLQAYLEEEGVEANRQTIYKAISILNDHGFDVSFHKERGLQGYCLQHPLNEKEAFVLISAVQESTSLSPAATKDLIARIGSLISEPAAQSLPETLPAAGKAENNEIMDNIGLLMKAIAEHKPAEFQYFDLTVTKQKQYRRKSSKYVLIPYAITEQSGYFYCVFYSPAHESFGNYRIDKMDHLNILWDQESVDVRFSLADHIRSSFSMYRGEAETITVRFRNDLANTVFDQFGRDIIISETDEQYFTANIKTAVTPTLVSWLLQFTDRSQVLKPDSLIEQLLKISEIIQKTYGGNKDE